MLASGARAPPPPAEVLRRAVLKARHVLPRQARLWAVADSARKSSQHVRQPVTQRLLQPAPQWPSRLRHRRPVSPAAECRRASHWALLRSATGPRAREQPRLPRGRTRHRKRRRGEGSAADTTREFSPLTTMSPAAHENSRTASAPSWRPRRAAHEHADAHGRRGPSPRGGRGRPVRGRAVQAPPAEHLHKQLDAHRRPRRRCRSAHPRAPCCSRGGTQVRATLTLSPQWSITS